MPATTDLLETARHWLVRLERESTPELWDQLQGWLEEHPHNRVAFIRARTLWNRFDVLKMLRPEDGTIDADLLATLEFLPPGRRAHRPRRALPDSPPVADPRRRRWVAGAAAAAIAAAAVWFGAYRSSWDSYHTEIGARQQLRLSDGSTVDLNTDTDLSVRMGDARRDLHLQRGEALFHVAHAKGRPFLVRAGDTVVRAVGTAFLVRILEDDRIEVLVTEGRVVVDAAQNPEQRAMPAAAAVVSAGEGVFVRHALVTPRSLLPAQITRKLAWTSGEISFEGETLSEAVGEFNRYNTRRLSIADPSITAMQVGGIFLATDPDSFAAALEHSFGLQALRSEDGRQIALVAGKGTSP